MSAKRQTANRVYMVGSVITARKVAGPLEGRFHELARWAYARDCLGARRRASSFSPPSRDSALPHALKPIITVTAPRFGGGERYSQVDLRKQEAATLEWGRNAHAESHYASAKVDQKGGPFSMWQSLFEW